MDKTTKGALFEEERKNRVMQAALSYLEGGQDEMCEPSPQALFALCSQLRLFIEAAIDEYKQGGSENLVREYLACEHDAAIKVGEMALVLAKRSCHGYVSELHQCMSFLEDETSLDLWSSSLIMLDIAAKVGRACDGESGPRAWPELGDCLGMRDELAAFSHLRG